MTVERCKLFKVYDVNKFFPIHWKIWRHYYFDNYTRDTLETVRHSIGTHMWNSQIQQWNGMRKDERLSLKSPYLMLAKNFCPEVYQWSSTFFWIWFFVSYFSVESAKIAIEWKECKSFWNANTLKTIGFQTKEDEAEIEGNKDWK